MTFTISVFRQKNLSFVYILVSFYILFEDTIKFMFLFQDTVYSDVFLMYSEVVFILLYSTENRISYE